MTAQKVATRSEGSENADADSWAGYHWAVEMHEGDSCRTRLVKYQTRERPARMSAEHGSHRLLCRQVVLHGDGSEWYGPWRDAALAGLIDPPTSGEKINMDRQTTFKAFATCNELNPHKEGYTCCRPAGHADYHLYGPPEAATADPERLYFVYREDSTLPLLAGWRDEEAALQYARDSNATVVLGIDVSYRGAL